MLTQDQIDFYRVNGYLTVANILIHDELAEANVIIDDFIEKSRTVMESSEHCELEPDHTPEHPRVRRLGNPVAYHPLFDTLRCSDRILACLVSLIGPDIRALGNKINLKPGHGGTPVEWHQDFAHHPHTNSDLCAVGIALEDTTVESGCMMVVPGSHTGPVLDHHQNGFFIGGISPQRDGIDLSTAVPLELNAGDISIHHTLTLHGSAANTSSTSRRFLIYEYAAADAWSLPSVEDWDAFNASMLCGESTQDLRMESMKVRMRNPSDPRSGRGIFELQRPLEEKFFGK
jgi:phytanoyl-CoA hydroxylase